MHRVLVLSAAVDGRVAREVVKRERDAQAARTDAGLRDELGALDAALCGRRTLGREARDQPGVRGNGLSQVGAHGRVLPGIEAQCARDLEVDGLLQVTKVLELGHLIVIDIVIVLQQSRVSLKHSMLRRKLVDDGFEVLLNKRNYFCFD